MRGTPVQATFKTLAAEVAATHPEIAVKINALDQLYAGLHPDNGGHRPLTAAERKTQVENTLTLDEAQTVQAIEWGCWRANQPIMVGDALAFNVGHPVPVSHVARFGWDVLGVVDRVVDPASDDDTPDDDEADDPDDEVIPAPAADDTTPTEA